MKATAEMTVTGTATTTTTRRRRRRRRSSGGWEAQITARAKMVVGATAEMTAAMTVRGQQLPGPAGSGWSSYIHPRGDCRLV